MGKNRPIYSGREAVKEPLGYSRDGDIVTLRMSVEDYEQVLVALGYRAGQVMPDRANEDPLFWRWIALANRISAGNAEYIPYEVPEALR